VNTKVRTAFLLGIALVLGALTVVLWLPPEVFDSIWQLVGEIWTALEDHPVILYLCMVILPAFFVPQSPFLVLAGIVYAESMGEIPGAAVAASAVALNILWSYFLTVGPLHALADKVLSRFGYSVPKIAPENYLKFSFLVRVTPVLPLCVQNYTLGMLKVPLHLYLLASWTTQVPLAFAIALTAGAILEGNLVVVLLAVAVLLAFVFGLKWLRKRLGKEPGMENLEEQLGAEDSAESSILK